jgi:hypothetical protein
MSGECQRCHEHCLGFKCVQNLGCDPSGTMIDPISFKPVEYMNIPDISEEKVNHPLHYQGNNIEVIDVIEDFGLGFSLGNAIKYILRAGKKGDRVEDLRKAIWYIEREITNEQRQI